MLLDCLFHYWNLHWDITDSHWIGINKSLIPCTHFPVTSNADTLQNHNVPQWLWSWYNILVLFGFLQFHLQSFLCVSAYLITCTFLSSIEILLSPILKMLKGPSTIGILFITHWPLPPQARLLANAHLSLIFKMVPLFKISLLFSVKFLVTNFLLQALLLKE